MWRTFFLSAGIALTIFGGEFLVFEKAIWAKEANQSDIQQVAGYLVEEGGPEKPLKEDFQPLPWVPWAMLSSGAIVILYCLSTKNEV
ncbi:MAG: hypothetical protein VX438_10430 [Planctomycetota bacterium]|nr:hypothetical protein [Planctomycetota bacterium]